MRLPLCVCEFFVSVGLIANLMSFSAKKQLSNLHFNEQHIDGDVLVTAKCVCVCVCKSVCLLCIGGVSFCLNGFVQWVEIVLKGKLVGSSHYQELLEGVEGGEFCGHFCDTLARTMS